MAKGKISMAQLVGKVVRKDAQVLMIFRVDGHYYPATEQNAEIFETYLHTGNPDDLIGLEHEIETEVGTKVEAANGTTYRNGKYVA